MPRRLRLIEAAVERLAPEQSEYTVWDTRTAGLGVRVRPSGGRSYVYLGRVGTDAAIRRRTLGSAARMSIDDARRAILVLQTAARDPRSSDGGPGRVTFREFVEAAWGPAFLGRYKPSSRKGVDTSLRTQLLPEFGKVPLERISAQAVHRWFDGYSATAPVGANHALKQLRVILRYAVRCGHLSCDPTRTVRRNPRARVTRFLSGEELDRLHRALDACVRERPVRAAQADIVRLLLVTGCRHGEIRNLRWEDVCGDILRLHDSKTGPRTVFLNAEARRILARQERNASRYVFPSPLDPARPRHHGLSVWSLVRRRAGLEDVRLHDCRHTFASQAVLRGVPIPVVARLLGHSDASILTGEPHVTDGDGIRVNGHEIRLAGLDAPEWDQWAQDQDGNWFQHGKQVKSELIQAIEGEQVCVFVHDHDRYGRLIATVTCNGYDVGEWLVEHGYAIAAYGGPIQAH